MKASSCPNPWAARGRCLESLALLSVLSLAVLAPGWSACALGSGTEQVTSKPQRHDRPVDEGEEEEEVQVVAQQALRNNCLMCHSVEMIEGQRLTPAQWKAEVEKMIGLGSPLPPEQVEPLIKFLSARFAENTPPTPPARMTLEQALATVQPESPDPGLGEADPARGAAIHAMHCATCHGPTGQGGDLGTNLVEVAVLQRQTDFREVIQTGRNRMPGFTNVLKPEQVSDILAWLRSRRYEAAAQPPKK